jgi:hypothetical protein
MCRAAVNNINVASVHVKCPTFLSDFNQIGVFSTHFRNSTRCKISRKYVQWDPPWHIRPTDGRPKQMKTIGAFGDLSQCP